MENLNTSSTLGQLIIDIFGKDGKILNPGELIKSKNSIGLTALFGTLNKDSVRQMDEGSKVIFGGTTRALAKLPTDQRSWNGIITCFSENSLLEPEGEPIYRTEKMIKNKENPFFIESEPVVVDEVRSWFSVLTSDDEFLHTAQLDIETIVAQSGATINKLEEGFIKEEFKEQTIVDIGVVKYPDASNPHFKVYRIKLNAWADATRMLLGNGDKNGITGEYSVRRFKPRDSVISTLRPEVKAKVIQETEELFN